MPGIVSRHAVVTDRWSCRNRVPRRCFLHAKFYRFPCLVRASATVWTDASFSMSTEGFVECKICWVVSAVGLGSCGKVYSVPQGFWHRCAQRQTHITMAESPAFVLLLRDCDAGLQGRSITCFIDNLAALCDLVMGYSPSTILRCIYCIDCLMFVSVFGPMVRMGALSIKHCRRRQQS